MRTAVACLILLVPITAIASVDNAVVMVEGCSGVNGGEKSWRWAVEKCGALEWRISC